MSLIKSLVLVPLFAAATALAGGSLCDPSARPADASASALFAAAPSASVSGQDAYFAPFIRFDPDAGNLDITFGIERGARISLQAFDGQGKLLAVLLDADEGAGFHQLSLFSNRLQGHRGHVVFQLRADNSMLADTRLSAR